MNERQEAWTTFLINEQVKPSCTNYQPQDSAKTIWNVSSRLKKSREFTTDVKIKKTSIFLREFKIFQNVQNFLKC